MKLQDNTTKLIDNRGALTGDRRQVDLIICKIFDVNQVTHLHVELTTVLVTLQQYLKEKRKPSQGRKLILENLRSKKRDEALYYKHSKL